MKNVAKLLAVILTVVLCMALFVACDINDDTKHVCQHVCPKCGGCTSDCNDPICSEKCKCDKSVTHTVTIVGAIKSSTQQVKDGEFAQKPSADPTKSGYKFDGWFVGETEYNWDTPVTKDIIITAKFTKLFDVRNGSAVKNADGTYTTERGNTLITFDKPFSKGTLIGKVTPGTANDCGIVFGAAQGESEGWWENNNYYTVLVNFNGTVLISHVDSGWTELAHSTKLEATYNPQNEYTIKVQYNEGLLVVFVNDTEVYRNSNLGELPGVIAGYRAAEQGTTFKPLEIDENDLPVVIKAEVVDNFVVRNGKLAKEENNLVAKEANTLAVHNEYQLQNGTITAKMKAGEIGDSGIVFGMTQANEELFWEAGASYYFFFVNINGCAYLGKVAGGWQQCGNVPPIADYDVNKTYTLKVEVSDGTIRCYVDDVLYITYTDENFLLGTSVGLRAGKANTVYSEFTVTAETITHERPEGFDIVSGDFEKAVGKIKATSQNSMMISQTETLATNGTVSAKVLSGTDSGIVFGVKTNGNKNFWEGEDGISYYFFFVSKVGVPILAKIAPSYTEIKHSTLSAMYSANVMYDIKVVVKDGVAYCYVGDRLMIKEQVTLDGDGIGVRAEASNVVFSDFAVSDKTDIVTADTLIFGHSYTELWTTYKADFFDVDNILNIGIGGTVAADWLNLTDEVAAYNPSKLVYMIGINDMYGTNTGENIFATVAETLNRLHELLPSVKIVLINCNKVPLESKKAFYSQIDVLNAKYAEFATENSAWCTLVDFASVVEDGEGNIDTSLFVPDNLHLNANGYEKLTRLVRVALGLEAEGLPYKFVHGAGTYMPDKVTNTTDWMLAVTKERTFAEGTITAKIKMGTLSDSGIVFGLTDNGLANYWEDNGVSYYEFFITGWNGVYLAKINNGWNELKSLPCGMQPNVEYTLKVEWKDGNIRCYVDDVMYIDYTDANPLTGTKYGYRTMGAGVEYGPITTTDTVSERIVPPIDYNIVSGNAKESNGVITTIGGNTLLVNKTGTFAEGTITAKIKMGTLSDSGIVFGLTDNGLANYWEDNGVSYYEFFITGWNGVYLAKINNGWNELKSLPCGMQPNVEYTLKVEWKDGNIRCYVDDVMYIDYTDANPLTGTKYGYRAIGNGVEYGPITTTDTVSEHIVPPIDYNIVSGNAKEADGKITSMMPNTLLTNKEGSFTDGTITATIKTVAGSDSGIVFGLTDNGKANFWEDKDVSYYFFFINVNGDAYLAKAGGEPAWQQCGAVTHIADFNAANTYTLKVVRNGNNIKCYVNDTLYVDFTDEAALSGTKYGYRAQAAGVEYGLITKG